MPHIKILGVQEAHLFSSDFRFEAATIQALPRVGPGQAGQAAASPCKAATSATSTQGTCALNVDTSVSGYNDSTDR